MPVVPVATVAELEPVFTHLPSTIIAAIVEFITPQVMPPYTLVDYKEKEGMDWGKDDNGEFVRLMSIRGVDGFTGEHIHLDLRWFRLCRCSKWPCACISESAYATKIGAFLGAEEYLQGLEWDGGYWWDVSLCEGSSPIDLKVCLSLSLFFHFFILFMICSNVLLRC
jgi:hypothetical protein